MKNIVSDEVDDNNNYVALQHGITIENLYIVLIQTQLWFGSMLLFITQIYRNYKKGI